MIRTSRSLKQDSPKKTMKPRRREKGFSLVELVLVISIMGIVSVMITSIAVNFYSGYVSTSQRAEMVASAEAALQHIAREVRWALPNSIRVATGNAILEYMPISDGGRYRAAHSNLAGSDILDFTIADTSFEILGELSINAGDRMVIYNTGLPGSDIYESGSQIITPTTTTLSYSDTGGFNILSLAPGFQFALTSPQRRFYIVNRPATFYCDATNNQLLKLKEYTLSTTQPTNLTVAPLNAATQSILADDITSCSFTYQAGTSERNGLLTASLTMEREGEVVNLMHQIHINNLP